MSSSTSFPFGWNWNSGVSSTSVHPTSSVKSLNGVPFHGGNNVSRGLPFLGGSHSPWIFPLIVVGHVSCVLPFLGNVSIPRRFPFPWGTYSPTNIFTQGGTYFPREICFREYILLLLVHIWGDHMVHLVLIHHYLWT